MSEPISDSKMFAYMDRIFGEHKPITADIFLTNYCNNNCPYCTYKRWDFDDGAKSMSFADFRKYTSKLLQLGVKGIIITGGGEPTIAKEFDMIVDWLHSSGIHYGINTNFNVLKYCKPDYLKVSLDSWDEDSYKSNRGVEAYKTVRENIQKYAEWKKKNSPSTSLGIQILAKNMGDVFKFYEANKDLDVDYISIRPMESTCGSYYKNLVGAYVDMLPENIVKAINQLAALDRRVIKSFKWDLLDRQEDTCTASWAQIALNENGDVIYCCHKPYQIIGHIMDDDIMAKKARATTDMSMCDIPCRLTAPNMEVRRIMSAVEKSSRFI